MRKDAASERGTRTGPAESSAPSDHRWPITPHRLRTFSVSEQTGERRLMCAVLEDAIATFRRYRGAYSGRQQRLFELERAWFTRDDARQPFAVATVCNALGLDRALLRRVLQVWASEAAEPAKPPLGSPCTSGFRSEHREPPRAQGAEPDRVSVDRRFATHPGSATPSIADGSRFVAGSHLCSGSLTTDERRDERGRA